MKWMVDFNKLSSKQREVINKIVYTSKEPYWIKGFAGTGKTIVLLHGIEKIFNLNNKNSICYITYTNSLVELAKSAPNIKNFLSGSDILTYSGFIKNKKLYDYVFVDEIQDCTEYNLEKITILSKHLICAGDFLQQIYRNTICEKKLIDFLNPRIDELKEVFRLSPSLCKLARSVYPESSLVEGLNPIRTPDASIKIIQCESKEKEYAWVWREAFNLARPGEPSVILFPKQKNIFEFSSIVSSQLGLPIPPKPLKKFSTYDYKPFNSFWKSKNINFSYLGNTYGSIFDSDFKPFVYIMTYHSAKGLDFKNVFIPNMTYKTNIFYNNGNPEFEAKLFFVAVTRTLHGLVPTQTNETRVLGPRDRGA
jgi:superfamily I DNA/RNA helicase